MEMDIPRTQMWRMIPCNLNDDNNNNNNTNNTNKAKLNLMELPMEILVGILKRVPAKSVCCTRCVSKTLLSIVDSPSFVMLHTRFLLSPDSPPHVSPQLILRSLRSHYAPTRHEVMALHSLDFDHANPQAPQLNVSEILYTCKPIHYTVHSVFCNLFCIKHRVDDALGFLINPLRGEVLRLPPSRHTIAQVYGANSRVNVDWTGMGFDSITNTCKILRVSEISYVKNNHSESCLVSQVLVLGTSLWRQVPSAPPFRGLNCTKTSCAYGDMHWLLNGYTRQGLQGKTHILSFDFRKEEFFWTPNPYILPDGTLKLHLITFRGAMAIVDTTSNMNIEIWVMKDYNKKQWMLDYFINIDMLELDPQFDFWFAACGEWEHGILFIDQTAATTLFLDLRPPVVTKYLFNCPIEGWDLQCKRIMSLNGSLISLKSYANLVETEEPATYGNWTQGEASGKNFFYLKRH